MAAVRQNWKRHIGALACALFVGAIVFFRFGGFEAADAQSTAAAPALCYQGIDTSPNALDESLSQFSRATYGWTDKTLEAIGAVFWAFFGIETILTLVELAPALIANPRMVFVTAFGPMMKQGLRAALFTSAPSWIPALVEGIFGIGAYINGGTGDMAFSDPRNVHIRGVAMQSLCLVGTMWHMTDKMDPVGKVVTSIGLIIPMFLVLIGFTLLIAQLYFSCLESYLIQGIGPIQLAGLGIRQGEHKAMQFVSALITVGVTLASISAVIGLSLSLGPIWAADLREAGDAAVIESLAIGCAALTIGIVAWHLPQMIQSKLNGGVALAGAPIIMTAANWAQSAMRTGGGGSNGGGERGLGGGSSESDGKSSDRDGDSSTSEHSETTTENSMESSIMPGAD